jgi:hypothetical protein
MKINTKKAKNGIPLTVIPNGMGFNKNENEKIN